jgi:nondiscriminating glutamyl-tRNA synthetase
MRQEGIPTYNFAAVVDDYLMKITYVIRGDDHVSNTPRQILLYQALEIPLPFFAHIPMILGSDRQRLSKRHGATSLDEYQVKGYLPEALINYLSLLSWSSISGDEILSIERLIAEFDFSRISKSAAVFDITKLNWMNGTYIRASDDDALTELALPYLDKAGRQFENLAVSKKIVFALKEKIDYLEQLVDQAKIFFQETVNIENGEARAIIRKESSQKVLWSLLRELRSRDSIDINLFRDMMKIVQKETGIMGKDLWMPVRVALTGSVHGPDLPAIVELFGNKRCIKFIESMLNNFRQ